MLQPTQPPPMITMRLEVGKVMAWTFGAGRSTGTLS
jgi:hypothetical protein